MKKCYIAGKISNLPVEEYTATFEQAEAEVTAMGMVPVSPIKLDHTTHDKEWASYMKTDIKAMLDCDCVYAMRGWTESDGACIEISLAGGLRMKIIYQAKLNDYPQEDGRFYKMVGDKKIYQAEERTLADKEFNDRCNAWRQRSK